MARASLPRSTRGAVVAEVDGGRQPAEAYGVDRAGAMAANRAADHAYAAALGGLAARVRVATHASRGYHAPPPLAPCARCRAGCTTRRAETA